MKFIQHESHPLRMYIEDAPERVKLLSQALHDKFYYDNQYQQGDVEDFDGLIFEENGMYFFPSGIVSIVKDCAQKIGFTVDVSYCDTINTLSDSINVPEDLIEGITLRDYQIEAIRASLIYKRGIIQSPTGSGKSNMMIGVGRYLLLNDDCNILMCVPSSYLLHQTYDNAVNGGISESDICKYGDGNQLDPSKRVVIGTIQTIYRRVIDRSPEFTEWLTNMKCLILDEVQHIGSMTWYSVADKLQPEYLLGFSAEPFYGDKEHQIRDLISRGTLGPILYRISTKDLIDKGYLSKPYVVAMNSIYKGNMYTLLNWHSINKAGLIENKSRNNLIIECAKCLTELGKNPLILVQQIKHGTFLATELSKDGKKVAFMTGGSSVTIFLDGRELDTIKDSEGVTKKQFLEGNIDMLIGTSVLDEGVDLPALSSVILAGGGKSKIKLIQRLGRGLRPKKGDNTTVIVDFQDKFNLVTHKHFKGRKTIYDNSHIPVYFADNVATLRNIVINNSINPNG